MRALFIGISAALAFGALNGAIFHFSEGKNSLLYFGIFGVVPIDWALIGIWMGVAIGLTHRGVEASDGAMMFVSGAVAALFCTLVSHIIQFISVVGFWDVNGFIQYLGIFGEFWKIGSWYMWLSTALATLTGGAAAYGLSLAQRADNIRSELPDWLPPTSRILIHVARADGHIDENEAGLITALVRAQMQKQLSRLPKDFDNALAGVIDAEIDAINNGRTLEHELTEKCFASVEQREITAKLAIAIAQCDGEVVEAESQILDRMLEVWKIDETRRGELAGDAFNEFERAL